MKRIIIFVFFFCFIFNLNGQTKMRLPGIYATIIRNYPRSNDEISFSLPFPLNFYKDVQFDSLNTHQYLIKQKLIPDSLLSVSINQVMKSMLLDLAYRNIALGTEIWYGTIANGLNIDPSMIGVYYKNIGDSTNLYILTTYSLELWEKKRKPNTSKYVGETIKTILDKYHLRK